LNLGYIGEGIVNITLYDNSEVFGKVSSLITIKTLYPNVIGSLVEQSNPSLS